MTHGCGCGCLGCLGMVAVLVGVVSLVSFVFERPYDEWSDMRPYLDQLQPGMTEAEVRALFPKQRFKVEGREWDSWPRGTWVVAPDAGTRPARRLWVRPKSPPGVRMGIGEMLSGAGEDAQVYFDAEGRLWGAGFSSYQGRPWQAKWGAESEGSRCDCDDEGPAEAEKRGDDVNEIDDADEAEDGRGGDEVEGRGGGD